MDDLHTLLFQSLIDFHDQEEREGRCPSCGRLPEEPAAWDICAEFHGPSQEKRD